MVMKHLIYLIIVEITADYWGGGGLSQFQKDGYQVTSNFINGLWMVRCTGKRMKTIPVPEITMKGIEFSLKVYNSGCYI